ncbi:hypothetical protein Celal_1425 [Cellulophaga algicola DSM 14237]|uniref:Lipoprotein n=1 Tax=Cellulophaga algicola (strain DSM 14237 / IC166 / ACAM 630) TaxID=688270 RepID=E6X9I8_CELAD|nr:hypothetical protein [Cellulophaga algicola]ADV48738.1 hypothetical protein Celal_1425 [Cellulophaga algicola DSM 14237]
MPSNKMMLYGYILILISSCATLKKNEMAEHQIELTNENLHLINGTYENNEHMRPPYLDYFWGSYLKAKEFKILSKEVTEEKNPYLITLKVVNKKKINATVKIKDRILKTYTIRGRIKNGYFEQNRKMYILPALLINEYHSSKFRIGLLENDKVITDYRKIEFGTVYFFQPYTNTASDYNQTHNSTEH